MKSWQFGEIWYSTAIDAVWALWAFWLKSLFPASQKLTSQLWRCWATPRPQGCWGPPSGPAPWPSGCPAHRGCCRGCGHQSCPWPGCRGLLPSAAQRFPAWTLGWTRRARCEVAALRRKDTVYNNNEMIVIDFEGFICCFTISCGKL